MGGSKDQERMPAFGLSDGPEPGALLYVKS